MRKDKRNKHVTIQVEAIENGTVIDHIPAGLAHRISKFLQLSESGNRIYLGFNLHSNELDKKDLLKIENITLSEDEANQIALYAPKATINIVRDYEVQKKYRLSLPKFIRSTMQCPNSNCISNFEQITSFFYIQQFHDGQVNLKCKYCEKAYSKEMFGSFSKKVIYEKL